MFIQNISNKWRDIYIFERLPNGELKITSDKTFYPYFFEPHPDGKYQGYDGTRLHKIICNAPGDVAKNRSEFSYESDILYTKRYILDKVDVFEKAPLKYIFLDIEILAPELPDTATAEYPISCVTTYCNFTKEYKTWFLKDWSSESKMLDDFVDYLAKEQPDMISAWNCDFDYTYMYGRIKDFDIRISPVGQNRMGKLDCFYPSGISVVDYKGLYEKLTLNKRRSYALDYIAQEDLGEVSWGNTEFGVLTENIKLKNINDVVRMVKIEEKYKMLPHFDEVRRFSKVLWEDLPQETIRREGRLEKQSNNSKIIDMLLLQEAKKRGVILPKKPSGEESSKFEGAYRKAHASGAFFNVGTYDISGAYLRPIIDLYLDPINIRDVEEENTIPINITDRETGNYVCTYYVKQDPAALLPSVVSYLLKERDKIRNKLQSMDVNDAEYDIVDQSYNAIKSIVLSLWGVFGNKYFRLYNSKLTACITSPVRDVLHYVEKGSEVNKCPTIYVDTDGIIVNDSGVDISPILNQLVETWSLDRFNKKCSINFEYKGHFTKLFIKDECHYYGYLQTKKGLKKEVKGIEVKRSSSSKYEAKFQEELINRILDKNPKDIIIDWIRVEEKRIRQLPYSEIGFPCKINSDTYTNDPIFVRAARVSKELFPEFKVSRGDLFYYIFINPIGNDKLGKPRNVLAINDTLKMNGKEHLVQPDWDEIIRRNIISKADTIFSAMKWGSIEGILKGQTSLW